jgi:hypothetical protein
MDERAEPSFPNLPAPEGDDSYASAPLDDSEYSHVRRRSDFEMDIICDEEQEKTSTSSRPDPTGCKITDLPPPPNKRNRRGSYERTTYFPCDVPATHTPRSSDTTFDIYVSNIPSSRVSSIFDDDINLTPLPVHTRRRNQEKQPSTFRRKSLEIEDLEDSRQSE